MSLVTLCMTVTMWRVVSCRTSLPDMYRDMVGMGVPMAMQRMVMLPPSITRLIGCTVGGCKQKYHTFVNHSFIITFKGQHAIRKLYVECLMTTMLEYIIKYNI